MCKKDVLELMFYKRTCNQWKEVEECRLTDVSDFLRGDRVVYIQVADEQAAHKRCCRCVKEDAGCTGEEMNTHIALSLAMREM